MKDVITQGNDTNEDLVGLRGKVIELEYKLAQLERKVIVNKQ